METVIAMSISGLFAYWIWMLKQEVCALRDRLQSVSRSGFVAVAGTDAPVFANSYVLRGGSLILPAGAPCPGGGDAGIKRTSPDSEGGIPTWTLG